MARSIVEFERKKTISSQGDAADSVMYIQKGGVKISVVSKAGKEAVVAIVGKGDSLGEGSLAGQPLRVATAKAVTAATTLVMNRFRKMGFIKYNGKLEINNALLSVVLHD